MRAAPEPPYRFLPRTDEEVNEAAKQILSVLAHSGLSYQRADRALSVAREMLGQRTRPVVIE